MKLFQKHSIKFSNTCKRITKSLDTAHVKVKRGHDVYTKCMCYKNHLYTVSHVIVVRLHDMLQLCWTCRKPPKLSGVVCKTKQRWKAFSTLCITMPEMAVTVFLLCDNISTDFNFIISYILAAYQVMSRVCHWQKGGEFYEPFGSAPVLYFNHNHGIFN